MQFSDGGVVAPRLAHVYCQRLSRHKNPPVESGDRGDHSQRDLLVRPREKPSSTLFPGSAPTCRHNSAGLRFNLSPFIVHSKP